MTDLIALVNEQAEDEGLWFIDATCSEAYLQAALRKLHAAVEARRKPRERGKMTDVSFSVVYRKGSLTAADYDEAIKDLQNAKRQDECRHLCCSVCEDTGHTAETCHHNPLLLARQYAAATSIWNCYHCGFIATNDEEAREHFGKNDLQDAKCVLTSQLKMLEKTVFDYPEFTIAQAIDALRAHVSGAKDSPDAE